MGPVLLCIYMYLINTKLESTHESHMLRHDTRWSASRNDRMVHRKVQNIDTSILWFNMLPTFFLPWVCVSLRFL